MAEEARDRPDLSVVFGTYNRLGYLKETVEFARAAAAPLAVEFIIADGGSTDGSAEWLQSQPDVVYIPHGLHGACLAFNACCEWARGKYVVHLNDDAFCMGSCLYDAWRYMEDHPEVGQAALAWRDYDAADRRYKTDMIFNYHYANFGMTRKWLGDYVGWFGTDYLTYQCDQELSLKVWELGYQVVLLGGCRVEHMRVQDKLRQKWEHDHGPPTKLRSRWAEKVAKGFPKDPVIREEDIKGRNVR